MNTYVVGDIQGCFAEFEALLRTISFRENQDRLIVAGDLINRGPNNLDTLRLLRNLSAEVVLGNHDLHFLAVSAGIKPASNKDTVHDLLAAPDLHEVVDWLRNQPLIIELKAHDSIVVHAGIPHIWRIPEALGYAREVECALRSEEYEVFLSHMYGDTPDRFSKELGGHERLRTITNYLTRMRFCTEDGRLDLKAKNVIAPAGFAPWFAFPRPDHKRILFGHWAAIEGKTGSKQHLALDTGCVWGRHLTAFRLEDNKLFSVPAVSS